jgi:tetratricopeptide (TPR) repeat protein
MHINPIFRILFILVGISSLHGVSRSQTGDDSLIIDDVLRNHSTKPEIIIPVLDSILSKYPNTSRRTEVEFDLAVACGKTGQDERAKKLYGNVLRSPGNDTAVLTADEMMHGNMLSTLNLRNYAAFNMAELFYKVKDYEQAISYYKMALYTYPFRHYSGTDINQHNIKEKNNLADAYAALGRMDSALALLLPYMFNPIRYSPEAMMKAAYLIMRSSDKDTWCAKLTSALQSTRITDTTMEFQLNSVLIRIPTVTHEFPNTAVTMTEEMDPNLLKPPANSSEAIKRFKEHLFYKTICGDSH